MISRRRSAKSSSPKGDTLKYKLREHKNWLIGIGVLVFVIIIVVVVTLTVIFTRQNGTGGGGGGNILPVPGLTFNSGDTLTISNGNNPLGYCTSGVPGFGQNITTVPLTASFIGTTGNWTLSNPTYGSLGVTAQNTVIFSASGISATPAFLWVFTRLGGPSTNPMYSIRNVLSGQYLNDSGISCTPSTGLGTSAGLSSTPFALTVTS